MPNISQQVRDNIRSTMIEDFGCNTLAWELPGPPDTSVAAIQCWGFPGGRLIIVEIYENGGCDIFPQVLVNGWNGTKAVVDGMAELEAKHR